MRVVSPFWSSIILSAVHPLTTPVTFSWRTEKWCLLCHWFGGWVGCSSIVKHPLTRDYWHAFTGKFRAWKETFLATMDPVCVAGAADMNRATKCITVTRQPVINANKMKGPYQKRQTQTWAVPEQQQKKVSESLFRLKSTHLCVPVAGLVCILYAWTNIYNTLYVRSLELKY